MAAKLRLVAHPTFKAAVDIPVPGTGPVPVVFEFKHRTKDGLVEFIRSADGLPDEQTVLAVASGWDMDEAFTAENVVTFLQNYLGAARAIVEAYMRELAQAKLGN